LGGTGPVLAALVIGNGQQAGQGRVAGQVSWRKCGNWRTSCPALHASILAIAMLIAACMERKHDRAGWEWNGSSHDLT